MKRRYERLFGSSRSRFFREKKRSSRSLMFKRSQRVRFRRRYAGSVLKTVGKNLWSITQVAIAGGLIVYGGLAAHRFWRGSDTIRSKAVVYENDVPAALRASFPVSSNQNLVTLNPWRLQRELLAKYPELKKLSIRRTFDRTVVVSGSFRTPVAKLVRKTGDWAVDENGLVFPSSELKTPLEELPWIDPATESDIKMALGALSVWKKDVPDFYSLVKKIETDRMHGVTVELTDGVLIQWGEMDFKTLPLRTKNAVRLRAMFEPLKTPAHLKFVTDERIVMDSNWQRKSEPKN